LKAPAALAPWSRRRRHPALSGIDSVSCRVDSRSEKGRGECSPPPFHWRCSDFRPRAITTILRGELGALLHHIIDPRTGHFREQGAELHGHWPVRHPHLRLIRPRSAGPEKAMEIYKPHRRHRCDHRQLDGKHLLIYSQGNRGPSARAGPAPAK